MQLAEKIRELRSNKTKHEDAKRTGWHQAGNMLGDIRAFQKLQEKHDDSLSNVKKRTGSEEKEIRNILGQVKKL